MKRTAILLDENGVEIYRGCPAKMPVRFISEDNDEENVDWCMAEVPDAGSPLDENGLDMVIHDGDWY